MFLSCYFNFTNKGVLFFKHSNYLAILIFEESIRKQYHRLKVISTSSLHFKKLLYICKNIFARLRLQNTKRMYMSRTQLIFISYNWLRYLLCDFRDDKLRTGDVWMVFFGP